MTLHTACGEIRDLKLFENKLTVFIKEEYLYNILIKEENYFKLLKLLKEQNDSLELEFVLKKKQEDKVKQNLEILKNIFGEDLIVN